MALPGVSTVLRDQFYTLSRTNVPVGPICVALATRNTVDGTNSVRDYDPYYGQDEQDVVLSFGRGSGAHRAYVELASGGAQTIYIVAIPSMSDAALQATESSLGAQDSPLDLAMLAAETILPDFIVCWGRGGHPSEWFQPATPVTVPVGFYADNSVVGSASMASRVASWCNVISNRSHPVLGVIGLEPFTNQSASPSGADTTATMTAAQIAAQVTFPNLIDRSDASLAAIGQYLTVVGTEVIPLGYDPAFGYANGASTFAGSLSQLQGWSSPTGKLIYNVSGIRYNPTRTQQQAMIDKGVDPVALNFSRQATWIEGKTFALDTSDYTRLTTLRIVYDAITMVRTVAQQFIGEAATLQHRNALETAITSGLRSMQQQGELLASDFRVTYIPAQNQANVDLVLTPAFEIRNILVTVSVQLG